MSVVQASGSAPGRLRRQELLDSLPPEWPQSLLTEIQQSIAASRRKVVALDDDPTGTQSVHGVPVLTEWPPEALARELTTEAPAFYVLTNSRSLPSAEACERSAEIGLRLRVAARQAGGEVAVISRSDSTLRGHFPDEVAALAAGLDQPWDAWILAPSFPDGGRLTIGNVHYVAQADDLIPVAETPYAADPAFGYRESNLRAWVLERSAGRFSDQDLASVSIDDIRTGGPARVEACLMPLRDGAVCIVNAASDRDLEVFVAGLLRAEARGKQFLYRTAATFVRLRAGLPRRELLTRGDLQLPDHGGGLIVAGSYVPATTEQITSLLAGGRVTPIALDVRDLLDPARSPAVVENAAHKADHVLRAGGDVLVYTSRELLDSGNAIDSLAAARRISDGLVQVVRSIPCTPRYLLAKGGITSSDIATRALGIRRAMVLGQILPGVPVWKAGLESRHPGLTYIVFPGNVGGPNALVDVVARLSPTS